MKYRIITNGKRFRIQYRFLFFFWKTVEETATNLVAEYDNIEKASTWIKNNTKEKWQAVRPEDESSVAGIDWTGVHPFSCPYPEGCNCGIGMTFSESPPLISDHRHH